jgi:hypothetical protein
MKADENIIEVYNRILELEAFCGEWSRKGLKKQVEVIRKKLYEYIENKTTNCHYSDCRCVFVSKTSEGLENNNNKAL